MNMAGYTAAAFKQFDSLLAGCENGQGSASTSQSHVFANIPTLNTTTATSNNNGQQNHPTLEGYNPTLAANPASEIQNRYASSAASSTQKNPHLHYHHLHHSHHGGGAAGAQHQQPHHTLYMSSVPSYTSQMAAFLGVQQPAPAPLAAQPGAAATAAAVLGFANSFDPLPLPGGQASAASDHSQAANTQQQQQGQGHHQHLRHSSFDELLMLSPNLLSAAVSAAAASGRQAEDAASLELCGSRSTSRGTSPLEIAVASVGEVKSTSPLPSSSSANALTTDAWLDGMSINVPALSVEPMSGTEVVTRLKTKMDDVLTRYIPCVDFLVQCQQDLRKGLALANQLHRGFNKRYNYSMTARQFFATHIDQLPQTFYSKNQYTMESTALKDALVGLEKLRSDSEKCQSQGCEAIKNSFLGGMKDGESWGLRRWLSKHGNALSVCTDLECILNACQKLDRSSENVVKLAEILRPLAKQVLERLQNDVPPSYQERSTAHPYLPFFHRLESALRGMSGFDPEDDDVICIDDDDEIDEIKMAKPATKKPPVAAAAVATPKASRKRKAAGDSAASISKRLACVMRGSERNDESSSSGESDDESVIEVVGVKRVAGEDESDGKHDREWSCSSCATLNHPDCSSCIGCGESNCGKKPAATSAAAGALETGVDDPAVCSEEPPPRSDTENESKAEIKSAPSSSKPSWPVPLDQCETVLVAANAMADSLDQVAAIFEQNQQEVVRPTTAPHGDFWDGDRYGGALRLFGSLLRKPESPHFVEPIDEDRLIQAGSPPYSHIIKNPLSFRDIVSALIQNVEESGGIPSGENGRLGARGLKSWNMWKGMDLLQAIDLVLLNSLAYGKAVDEGKSTHRTATNKLRRNLWNGINKIVSDHIDDSQQRKQCIPTRRSETSGFVVYKIRER